MFTRAKCTTRYMSTISLSTVNRGTLFEERSLAILQTHMSMSLRRVGGKNDGGIDLQGWWWVPSSTSSRPAGWQAVEAPDGTEPHDRRRIRIIAQCKAEKKKMGPNYVRELEGVMHAQMLRPGHSRYPTAALLVSESSFTRATTLRALSSPIPLLLVHLPPISPTADEDTSAIAAASAEEPARIASAVWNAALGGRDGLLGGELELRWERCQVGDLGRPGLWWRGKRLKSLVPHDLVDQDAVAEEDVGTKDP